MKIVNLDTVRQIGEEYGWDERTIEETLAHAIHMCYAERGQLVEVDVNMAEGSIACRRRSGRAEHGVWIDIDKPLMPTVKMFMNVMDIQQWGDGAPGRILEGEVAGYRDGGVIYRVLDQFVLVPEKLLSVADYQNKPPVGEKQVIVLCAGKDATGIRHASRRGREFVSAVMECYYPDCVSGIWMGASNSWAVIRMDADTMTSWLENGGMNVRYLQKVLGLRRITLLPEGEGETPQESKDQEVKHFINNAWRKCKIAELAPDKIVIHTPLDESDPRKLRTFSSMLKKLAPERQQVIL